MRARISTIPATQRGQAGWLLRWREQNVKLSHWFADVNEAMAVQCAMRSGDSFEAALRALVTTPSPCV